MAARVVFDLDGTLVDSIPTMAAAGNLMLDAYDRPPVSTEECADFVGNGPRKLVERLLLHRGGPPAEGLDAAVARFRAIYGADPITGTHPYPGVAEAVARLAAAGHGLAVCTQKPNAPALAILRGLGLSPPISGFTGGDSLDVLKPDPRMFRHAADQLPPGAEILVGDSLTDAETARAAGVPFLLHTRGYRRQAVADLPHDGAFDDFTTLPELVERVLGS